MFIIGKAPLYRTETWGAWWRWAW